MLFQAFEHAVGSHKTQEEADAADDSDVPDEDGDGDETAEVDAAFEVDDDSNALAAEHTDAHSFTPASGAFVPQAALLWPVPPFPQAYPASAEALNELLMSWYWCGFYAGRQSVSSGSK